ncbi:MAG: efflux RND transporter periplasmic adaptor subunit, partial [Saprospiraceae bacterium]
MKKILSFNVLYWVLIPFLIFGIWSLSRYMTGFKSGFLGFAENKHFDVTVDFDISVSKILIQMGDKVKKGDTLVVGYQPEFDEYIQQADVQIEALQSRTVLSKAEISSNISVLEKEMVEKVSSLETKIKNAETESSFYKNLVENKDPSTTSGPQDSYIQSLNEEISKIRQSYQQLIAQYRRQLTLPESYQSVIRELGLKKTSAENKKKQLIIYAPFDGTIGNINVREGENVKSYTSIISLYEHTPPLVTGYLNERYNAGFSTGDSVNIS